VTCRHVAAKRNSDACPLLAVFTRGWSTHITKQRLANMMLSALLLTYAGSKSNIVPKGQGLRRKAVFPVFFTVVWYLYYNFRVREMGRVRFQRTFYNTQIVEKAKLAQIKFNPVFWAFNRHAQTVTCCQACSSLSRASRRALPSSPVF
jgi:hypothetical protein